MESLLKPLTRVFPSLFTEFPSYIFPCLHLSRFGICAYCPVLSGSVMSDSLPPRELQPARLLCPWDFQGKNISMRLYLAALGSTQQHQLHTTNSDTFSFIFILLQIFSNFPYDFLDILIFKNEHLISKYMGFSKYP